MIDRFLKEKRAKFKNVVLLEQKDSFTKVVRSINNKLPFIILPDMDFGIKNNKFIDFFNIPAATVDTVPRLAKITKSKEEPLSLLKKLIAKLEAVKTFMQKFFGKTS